MAFGCLLAAVAEAPDLDCISVPDTAARRASIASTPARLAFRPDELRPVAVDRIARISDPPLQFKAI